MKFIYYCHRLEKGIPCTLKPNIFKATETEVGKRFYIHIAYDEPNFVNLTLEEVYRYCTEVVQINELYPYETQAQQDYYNAVIPNKIISGGTHNEDELERFHCVIKELLNFTGSIDTRTFYYMSEFISYELMFTYCDYNDRVLLQTIGVIPPPLTEVPEPRSRRFDLVILMTKMLFDKFGCNPTVEYKILNSRYYSQFDYIPFPLLINTTYLITNINYIIDNADPPIVEP